MHEGKLKNHGALLCLIIFSWLSCLLVAVDLWIFWVLIKMNLTIFATLLKRYLYKDGPLEFPTLTFRDVFLSPVIVDTSNKCINKVQKTTREKRWGSISSIINKLSTLEVMDSLKYPMENSIAKVWAKFGA